VAQGTVGRATEAAGKGVNDNMPENILFFGKEYHTGHLREAATELLDQDLKIVSAFAPKIDQVNPAIAPFSTPTLLRLVISPQQVSEKTHQQWRKRESWVTRLLVETHIIRYPHIAHMKLVEYMDSSNVLSSVEEAQGFLALRSRRLQYFLSDRGQNQTDALRLATHAFTENYILRRAMYDGVYLMRSG
jgi:hypothetical protein